MKKKRLSEKCIIFILACFVLGGCANAENPNMFPIGATDSEVTVTEKPIVTQEAVAEVTKEPEVVGTTQQPELPTTEPAVTNTVEPTLEPTMVPMPASTENPTPEPTASPTTVPTLVPTSLPTVAPTPEPTSVPTMVPTEVPTQEPEIVPTVAPTVAPTAVPTAVPTTAPTTAPTVVPTVPESTHKWSEISRSESTDCYKGITTIVKKLGCDCCGEVREETETVSTCDWQDVQISPANDSCVYIRYQFMCVTHGSTVMGGTTSVPGPGHDIYITHTIPNECDGTIMAFYACRNCIVRTPEMSPKIIDTFEGRGHWDLNKDARCDGCGSACTLGIHKHEERIEIWEADCINPYAVVTFCTLCKEELAREEGEPLGHDYEVEETVATCFMPGRKVYTCTRCRDTYREEGDTLDKNNHIWGSKCTKVKFVPVGDNEYRAELWLCEMCPNCLVIGKELEYLGEYDPETFDPDDWVCGP